MTKSFFQKLDAYRWPLFLTLAFVAGILLRVTYVFDMEYKEDEEYNFTQAQLIGNSLPWPWYGIPSGVFIVNPGMSIWVFTLLAKLFQLHTPTSLAHGVQLFALFGMSLVVPFAYAFVKEQKERHLWLWAFAFAMVNPFLVLYQRKLWPEPFLPFFTMLTLMGWWKRDRNLGAFVWGLVGACIGQVHMSGFFFAFALFLWTASFDRKNNKKWIAWFVGSTLGALPLIPWFIYLIQHPVHESMSAGWSQAIQLKYWVFWLTDPTGLHLGNPLGLLRGNTHLEQLSDFIKYPILNGISTYGVGAVHIIALMSVIGIFAKKSIEWFQTRSVPDFTGQSSPTLFLQNAAFIGCGFFLTITGVIIKRFYMAVTYPLEFIFLVRMASPGTRSGRILLITLWICELLISANFVGYIHVNQGSIWGDYGEAYRVKHSN